MNPKDSKLHRHPCYCTTNTRLVWCKSDKEFTNNKLLAICHVFFRNSIGSGGHTVWPMNYQNQIFEDVGPYLPHSKFCEKQVHSLGKVGKKVTNILFHFEVFTNWTISISSA